MGLGSETSGLVALGFGILVCRGLKMAEKWHSPYATILPRMG